MDAVGCTRDGDDYDDDGAGDDDDVDGDDDDDVVGGDDDCLFMKIYICSLITMDRLQLAAGCTSLNEDRHHCCQRRHHRHYHHYRHYYHNNTDQSPLYRCYHLLHHYHILSYPIISSF